MKLKFYLNLKLTLLFHKQFLRLTRSTMSIRFNSLQEGINSKKCIFCKNQMVPAPKLSSYEFGINFPFLTYGPKNNVGTWHQLSLITDNSSFSNDDTSSIVSFVFECPLHKYTSDISAYIFGGKGSYSCKEEGVLLVDKQRIIFVWNLLVIKQTKIYSLLTSDLPVNYNQADFLTASALKNQMPINIELVPFPSDSTKFLTKIKTYITFS